MKFFPVRSSSSKGNGCFFESTIVPFCFFSTKKKRTIAHMSDQNKYQNKKKIHRQTNKKIPPPPSEFSRRICSCPSTCFWVNAISFVHRRRFPLGNRLPSAKSYSHGKGSSWMIKSRATKGILNLPLLYVSVSLVTSTWPFQEINLWTTGCSMFAVGCIRRLTLRLLYPKY